jgi:hypothetical protein
MLPTTPASALGHRYLPHIADICAALAQVAARHRLLSPVLVLVWFRLRRLLARLDRLATRWQAGRLRPAKPRIRPRRAPPNIHPANAWLPRSTPRGHAWLIRLHQPLAQFAPRVEAMLADPDISALCAAAPHARKLLRPLCQMFGLAPPPYLATQQRPAPPSEPRPRKPEPPPPAEHSPQRWPFVPQRLRLRVPNLRPRKPPS